jgi:hypothetical protein
MRLPGKLLAGQGGIFHGGTKGKIYLPAMLSVLPHFATFFVLRFVAQEKNAAPPNP